MERERRKHPRFALDQMIELGFDRERYVQTAGVNASESGILCRTDSPFERYARVFLMLSVPSERKIATVQCEGIVMRCEKSGDSWEAGISITEISDTDRELLREYLKSCTVENR